MWYAVNLWFEGVHVGKPPAQNVWEERLLLLRGDSEGAVRAEGERLGKTEEHEYVSATGDTVRWLFRAVERVCSIESETLEHGVEVFSRFLSARDIQGMRAPLGQTTTRQAKTA